MIVIGDVHGCLNELKALLLGLSPPYKQEEDVLIFVGDLVGKGPDSCGVVSVVIISCSSMYSPSFNAIMY